METIRSFYNRLLEEIDKPSKTTLTENIYSPRELDSLHVQSDS